MFCIYYFDIIAWQSPKRARCVDSSWKVRIAFHALGRAGVAAAAVTCLYFPQRDREGQQASTGETEKIFTSSTRHPMVLHDATNRRLCHQCPPRLSLLRHQTCIGNEALRTLPVYKYLRAPLYHSTH